MGKPRDGSPDYRASLLLQCLICRRDIKAAASQIAEEARWPSAAPSHITRSVQPCRRPDAPTGLTAVKNGQTQIDLSWTAPAQTGGAAITGYFIESSPDGESATWTNGPPKTGLKARAMMSS